MKNNNESLIAENSDVLEESRKEDKKYVKKYTIFMILCGIFGVFLGMMGASIIESGGNVSAADFARIVSDTISMIAPYIMFFVSILATILIMFFYRKGRGIYNSWDGEDENVINIIEKKLDICMGIFSCSMIIYYIMLAVYIGSMFNIDFNTDSEGISLKFIVRFVLFLVSFIIFMLMLHIGQKKIIDFEKEINPEKKGSIYDINFQKKWEESCDEAEKLCIYKSAWMSYKAVNLACLILWILCTVGMVIFDFDIVSVFIVGIIWMVSTLSYVINASKIVR